MIAQPRPDTQRYAENSPEGQAEKLAMKRRSLQHEHMQYDTRADIARTMQPQ
jgi:hypothetical protein